jgi:hypothetical protein
MEIGVDASLSLSKRPYLGSGNNDGPILEHQFFRSSIGK